MERKKLTRKEKSDLSWELDRKRVKRYEVIWRLVLTSWAIWTVGFWWKLATIIRSFLRSPDTFLDLLFFCSIVLFWLFGIIALLFAGRMSVVLLDIKQKKKWNELELNNSY